MMSSSANDRPFLSSFRHIPPQESLVQLPNLTVQTKNGRRGERLIWSNHSLTMVKLGYKSFVDGRQDICKDKKNLICDQLLATKAEII